MNDSLAMTALSLINDIEKLNWNDHSMGSNQKADRFFKRKNKFDNHQQLQKSFAYQKSKRKSKENSININKSFVLQRSNLQQIGEQIIPRIKQEFANNVRLQSSICIDKHSKDSTKKLEMTLIFNYCKKIRKLYYFNKFLTSLRFRLFFQKLKSGIGRIYYNQLRQSLKEIKNENNILQQRSTDLNLQNLSHILNKKTIKMKAQSMAKIQIHSKKQSNMKYVHVFMVMMRKTVNKKLQYLMREGFDSIQLKYIK